MAEVNAKDLTTKTAPASTDSMLLFGTTTNEGAKITVDNLANNILERLATKTFPNQVGGSSAATILAQLATLNSNMPNVYIERIYVGTSQSFTLPAIAANAVGLLMLVSGTNSSLYGLNEIRCNKIAGSTSTTVTVTTDNNGDGQTLTREGTGTLLALFICTALK